MKKYLLLTLITLIGRYTNAQTNVYHPFPDSDSVWKINFGEVCDPFSSPFYCSHDYQYVLKGDTLINGLKHIKVFREEWESHCQLNPPPPPNNWICTTPIFNSFYIGAYRNDTVAKKVYLDQGWGDELIYDFSLTIGDTIHSFRCTQTITSIDSVLVGGYFRKRYTLGNGFSVIEGIGNVESVWNNGYTGPFREGCGEPCACNVWWGLSCFIQSGVPLYPDTSTCSAINGINSHTNSSAKAITVYPNPCKGIFTLSSHSSSPQGKFNLMDVTGKIVFTQTLNGMQPTQQINATALRDGFYLYEVVSDEKVLSTGKIVLINK